ncbi:MAG TPA: hypothetical protein VK830_01720 [Xanthomonadales bacterium]|nr:hypothetical protein [Xanthomonadales bacterium]
MQARVLVLGATGQIGLFTIPLLLAQGFEVLALSRGGKPAWYPSFEDVEWIAADATKPGSLPEPDMLVSAGPIDLALRLVGQCGRSHRAVVFSTSSVISKLASKDAGEQRQMQQILAQEEELAKVCASRGIALSLYRPTLVYGCGIDDNVSWLANWIRRFGFVPVAGGAAGLRQPVHAEDLATAAVSTLASLEPLALKAPLCGGSTISFREMVEHIFHGLGKPVRILALPPWSLVAAARLCRLIPGLSGPRPEMVRRQAVDLVFDDSLPREALGYRPRAFAPGPADFSLPTPQRLKRLAGLADS